MAITRKIFRFDLHLRAVRVLCLDGSGREINGAYGSGFIRRENGHHFLYTCWHLVTGYDMYQIDPKKLPDRMTIRVLLQNVGELPAVTADGTPAGVCEIIGGCQSVDVPLYESATGPPYKPRWHQDKMDKPDVSLNAIGIRVPFWRDAVKIQLPDTVPLSNMQLIDDEHCFFNSPNVGDRVFIVGYPYGYSARGMEQPTPVVLSRFIAALDVSNRHTVSLLDGAGAPGMSGGPIFAETGGEILLAGIYTGAIYPARIRFIETEDAALGTYCNLLWTWKVDPLVPYAVTDSGGSL